MARLSRLVDKEEMEERIRDCIIDYQAAVLAGAISDEPGVLPRMIADDVYNMLGEMDSEDIADWSPMTYDPEDEEGGN